MPFSNLSKLQSTDTFQILFQRNNQLIDRINELEVGTIASDGSIIISGPGSSGGITLGVNNITTLNTIIGLSGSSNIVVSGSVPGGLTLNSAIGISGAGLGRVTSSDVVSARNFIGFISGVSGNDSYTVTLSGRIKNSGLADNTLFYLNSGGTLTSTRPTSDGTVIKPVFLNIGATLGGIVLQQQEQQNTALSTYIKSASRTIAEIPTNPGLISGNVVYYNVSGTTWAKCQANTSVSSEVFGIVESIAGATATVVTHGSVNIPNSILNSMGSGGAGGNDIWFLSASTGGQLQNQAPTDPGHIIKPVFYQYPHEMGGVTFSGYLINYIGYAVGGTVDDLASPEGSNEIRLGEFKQVSFHGNRLGFAQNWLTTFLELIQQNNTPATEIPWLKSVPYELDESGSLDDYVSKSYIELSGGLVLTEEDLAISDRSILTDSELTGVNCLLTTDNPSSSLNQSTYSFAKAPLNKFIDYGVSHISKIKSNANWNIPANVDAQDRWAQLKRLWFSKTDLSGNKVKVLNWANAGLILSESTGQDRKEFGDFQNTQGIKQNSINTLSPNLQNKLKTDILTSFYLPGFILKRRGGADFPEITDTNGVVPLYSNWMGNFSQEIGFYIPRHVDLIYIYSPWWAIKNEKWNIASIDLYKFLNNCCLLTGPNQINWTVSTDGNVAQQFELKLTPNQLLQSVIGIHLPNYSSQGYKTLMRVL